MLFRSKNKIVKRTLGTEASETKKSRLSRILFYLLALIFGAVVVFVLIFSPFLQIRKVAIRGLEELDYDKVLGRITAALDQQYFGAVEKNNILLVRSRDLENILKADFKKISSVEIRKVFPDTLVVSIQERKGLLVWCSGSDCLMVDEKGFAYAPADFASPEVTENNLIVIRDASQSPVFHDRMVINPEIVNFILAIRKEMKNRLALELNQEFETPKAISGDIVAVTNEGWKIRLNKELGAAKEVEMLQIVLDQNIGEEKRADLDYVDLRTENKVYYKLKSAAVEESPTDEDNEAGNGN